MCLGGFLFIWGVSEMSRDVLVLNSDYEPLNICNVKRAISLIYLGKVDILEENEDIITSVRTSISIPSVVRLKRHIKRPRPKIKVSRSNIFARDNHTCQYCGYKGPDLTIDHIIPKKLGGATAWDNLVCCCKKCNNKKSDKTLNQIGYLLRKKPSHPKYVPFISLTKFVAGSKNTMWRNYLPVFEDSTA